MKTNLKLSGLIIVLVMIVVAGTLFINEIGAREKTYKIGDKGPAGGWIFHDRGNKPGSWRYLEAAPESQSMKTKWGCYGKSIPGAKGTAIGTGKVNTEAIIKGCGESGIAAKVATAYRGGGKSDWFLPSKDELNLMCINLRKNGIGGFSPDVYWSSSEKSADAAWSLRPYSNQQKYIGKELSRAFIYDLRVRAIRAF